jgi:hypothetical protein
MNPTKLDNVPTIVYVGLGYLCVIGIVVGVLLVLKFIHSLIPKYGILVPLSLLIIIISFLKATKKNNYNH